MELGRARMSGRAAEEKEKGCLGQWRTAQWPERQAEQRGLS